MVDATHPCTVTMDWQNPASLRYYSVCLEQDLFSDWVLVKIWGRRGTKLGRKQQILCESYQQGIALIHKISKQRKAHGYKLVHTSL